jgi:cell division septum initiation protein DivIVA
MAGSPPEDDVSSSENPKKLWYLDFMWLQSLDSSLPPVTVGRLQDFLNQAVAEATEPLKAEIKDLTDEMQDLRQEVQYLKDTKPGITSLRVDDAFEAIEQIDEHLAKIDRTRTATPPQGSKTAARITKLKTALKARSGGMTFKEAEKLLGIERNQMTKLVSQLDKRSFEIFARAGNKREKIIRLKSFT